jgi:tetratricopeptide (TPR) repeat protein
LVPDNRALYANLVYALLALQRFDEARQLIREAQARNLDDYTLHVQLYSLAFFENDSRTMAAEQQWFAGQPDLASSNGLSLEADTEAYAGHAAKARELTKRSIDSAIRADIKETGGVSQAIAAQREAASGNAGEAKQQAAGSLKLVPNNQAVEVEAALAFAMAGDIVRAESLAQDLNKRFPLNTQMQSLWLPAIRAQLALDRKSPAQAISDLQAAAPIELGTIPFLNNVSCLYHTYIRGEAYLAAGQGKEGAAEFQKIIDHNGIVWNCWTGALAHLGVARANALQSRNFAGGGCRPSARSRALARLQRLPHPLERRRSRHPHPEASQSRVREAAIAPFDPSQGTVQVWQHLPRFAQMTFRKRGCVGRNLWSDVDCPRTTTGLSNEAGGGLDHARSSYRHKESALI